jgi:hypothetical protein
MNAQTYLKLKIRQTAFLPIGACSRAQNTSPIAFSLLASPDSKSFSRLYEANMAKRFTNAPMPDGDFIKIIKMKIIQLEKAIKEY